MAFSKCLGTPLLRCDMMRVMAMSFLFKGIIIKKQNFSALILIVIYRNLSSYLQRLSHSRNNTCGHHKPPPSLGLLGGHHVQ